jgi:hypothetical protein
MGKKSSRVFYKQCRYERVLPEGGTKFDVAWLPEKLCKVGGTIYFGKKRKDVAPDELWTVTSVGDNRRSAEWLNFKHSADSHQREASDI